MVLENNECQCGRKFIKDSKNNNFLVYIPLEPQIRRLLDKYFDKIINYLNREHKIDVFSDIHDGTLYEEICKKNPHVKILGFTLNTDGANIYKSSKGSLWPVQLYANFLPPNIRFASENIIVSTLYYGNKKPNMTTLLYSLAAEINYLGKEHLVIHRNNELWCFRPTIMFGLFDLPARAEMQGMKGPNGKFGCPICLHPGYPVKNLSNRTTIRYITKSEPFKLRTHADTVLISKRIGCKRFNKWY